MCWILSGDGGEGDGCRNAFKMGWKEGAEED